MNYNYILQKFVDRAKELEFLERHFKGEEAGFIVLYGRRRVGKTELLNRFIHNKKHIYFLARRESEAETFYRLSMGLFKMFHDELLLSRPFSSHDSFFEYLRIIAELKEKSTYVDWHRKERTVRHGIIARRIGIEDKKDLRSKGYLVYDLEDLETLMKPSDS